MSYSNFKKALEQAKTLPEYKIYDCCSDKAMDELEDYLGFELSRQHYEFLRLGALEVRYFEFYANFKDMHTMAPDIIFDYESNKKNGFVMREKCVPLLEEDEETYYLDYNRLTKEGEPMITVGIAIPEEFVLFEEMKMDLGDFLLQCWEGVKVPEEYEKNGNW